MNGFEKIDQITNILIAERNRPLFDEEQSILNEWIRQDDTNKRLYESLSNERTTLDKLNLLSEFNKGKAFVDFIKRTNANRIRSITRRILGYAAVVIPLIVASYFIFPQISKIESETQLTGNDIQPGSSKAVLVLEDGRIIDLEDEGVITENEDIEIRNFRSEIIYRSSGSKKHDPDVRYNILKIPRGGKYQLCLSDGTKIWLNAESEIRYPVIFPDKRRDIYLKGEAYFEVAEKGNSPFIVTTPDISVKVLGTHFNLRAYSDENLTTTTLVYGKVMIRESETQKELTLSPNEQSVTSTQKTVVKAVNVNPYIAWKAGRILFEENTIGEIFNDLSRRYNIEVEYADREVRELRFSIDLIRYENINEVLEILELTERIRFEKYDNKLLILKN